MGTLSIALKMIRKPGPMLQRAMKGMSNPNPSMGGRFMGVKIKRSAYSSEPRKMKKIEADGMMLVMKTSVRRMFLFFNRGLVKIAARTSATIISSGTVNRKYPSEPNKKAPACVSSKKRT